MESNLTESPSSTSKEQTKLTAKQRYEAYQWAIEQLEEEGQWVCPYLEDWLRINGIVDNSQLETYQESLSYFPEFQSEKPKGVSLYSVWFNNTEERIQALKNAIKKLD